MPAPHSAAGLNVRRDDRHSVAMHNHKRHDVAPCQPVTLVSPGHPRRIRVRARAPGAAEESQADDQYCALAGVHRAWGSSVGIRLVQGRIGNVDHSRDRPPGQ